jgi:hypothetical protein
VTRNLIQRELVEFFLELVDFFLELVDFFLELVESLHFAGKSREKEMATDFGFYPLLASPQRTPPSSLKFFFPKEFLKRESPLHPENLRELAEFS